ncbi:MAG TPA: glycine--tRNA ligase, partial [Phycisphaerae bacterium]|nr:glycine--tRNA ligase [Phycisphaerae bacterium]
MAEKSESLMDKLVALCKRRGFIFQSSEIYGGINGFWDYGPLGAELKRNVKEAWWEDIVRKRDDIVGLDCSIIMNPRVWEASGHVTNFNDPLVDCKGCKARFRADKVYQLHIFGKDAIDHFKDTGDYLAKHPGNKVDGEVKTLLDVSVEADTYEEALAKAGEAIVGKAKKTNAPEFKKIDVATDSLDVRSNFALFTVRGKSGSPALVLVRQIANEHPEVQRLCPICGREDSLTPPRAFNMMFKTFVGAMEDSSAVAYLRPETAQGIFCNYKNVLDTQRIKVPFGIAQIGKSFRNEINPRNYTFRSREFEQMEIEFFCHPNEADKWYEYWRNERYQWYIRHGLTSSKLRLRDHEASELAHYARACADVEYEFPFGISELEGVANRTDFDLKQHQQFSGKDLVYFDDETKERFLPYVIEPSGG